MTPFRRLEIPSQYDLVYQILLSMSSLGCTIPFEKVHNIMSTIKEDEEEKKDAENKPQAENLLLALTQEVQTMGKALATLQQNQNQQKNN